MSEQTNLKTAQFGGVGGGQMPYAPGSSPIGRGNGYGGGWDINRFVVDKGLDYVMEQTHNPAPIDPERNIEKRLEDQHKYAEEDTIPYDLSPAERERLRIRREIHRRNQYYAQAVQSLHENSPEFIKTHFAPKVEHVTTIENSLQPKRKMDDTKLDKHPYEDEIPPQIKPTRYHPVLSETRAAQIISRPNEITDEEADEKNWADKAKRSYPLGLGSTPLLETGADLDAYLDAATKQDWAGQKSTSNVPTIAFDNDEPDEHTLNRAPEEQNLPSSVGEMAHDVVNGLGRIESPQPSIMDIADDPFLPMEAKLDQTKRSKPQRAPSDAFPDRRWQTHQDESRGLEDDYTSRWEAGSPPARV